MMQYDTRVRYQSDLASQSLVSQRCPMPNRRLQLPVRPGTAIPSSTSPRASKWGIVKENVVRPSTSVGSPRKAAEM
jgi:hypothetical protein